MAPERTPERDAAIAAMLPLAGERGWNVGTLTEAAGPDADLLFPGGAADMVEAYCDLADRWMEADAAAMEVTGMRVPARVKAIIMHRLERAAPHREAVRRALGVLAAGRGALATACTARTVDTIWHAAGDRSADFSWYTKRAILTAVYGATLLFWLRDDSPAAAATSAFLDRRLAGVARVGRVRKRIDGLFRRGATA